MAMRLALIPLLALGLAACGAKQDGPAGPPGGTAPAVTVAAPMIKPIVDWDDYIGRFEARHSAEIRPRITGQVARVAFDDGQFVRAGDLLFVLDPRPFNAALAQAKAEALRARATADLARSNFTRTDSLMKANAVSREEFDTARATSAQAAASLAAAEATVQARALDTDFTRVTAPISGRMSDRRVDVGTFVTSGITVMTTVVMLNPIYFVFTGSEAVYLKH